MRPMLMTLAATMLAGAALVLAPGAALADTPSTGAVLFADDFTGSANSAPNSTNWYDYSSCTYDSTAAFGSIDCGVDETLDGSGHLVIPADATHGSALRTHFTFQYGTMTARMKMPATEGYWPAFWSLNNDPEGGAATSTVPVGEADAVESFTKWLNVYQGAGHTWTGSSTTDFHSSEHRCPASEDADLTQWHDYSAKIEPGKITWYFDGVQCGDAYEKTTGHAWGFGPDVTRGNFLILQNAVGGAGGQQATPSQADNVLVDRVEVRALDEPSAAVENGETYAVTNTCGGKALAAQDATNIAQLKTANPSSSDDLQKWVLSTYPNGKWKIKNVASSMTANVFYSSTDNEAPVGQYADNGGANAEWVITPGINGNYQINNVNSGKNLDVPANNTAAGVGVDQYANNTSCGQTWQLAKLS